MMWCLKLISFWLFMTLCLEHRSNAQAVDGNGVDAQTIPVQSRAMRKDPTYLAVASKIVRPGKIYKLTVTVFQALYPITIIATIQRNGVSIASDSEQSQINVPVVLSLEVPSNAVQGDYKIQIDGHYVGTLGSMAFQNISKLDFSQRSMTIFIQTDRPFYQQGQDVRFRAVPINTDLKAFDSAVDVYMLDPNRIIMKRWMSRQTNLGAVSLKYPLSQQPVTGKWTIKVVAQNQIEEKTFYVEEYYQTRYEVKVQMPAIFMTSSQYIHGYVLANYTSGAPVEGNLTIRATVRRLVEGRRTNFQITKSQDKFYRFFSGHQEFHFPMDEFKGYIPNAEIKVEAVVGEYFYNSTESGFSSCVIYNNSLQLKFLGASPQVIKPSMPFKAYLAISYFDGAALPEWKFEKSSMQLRTTVHFHDGGAKELDNTLLDMNPDSPGLWKVKVDLAKELRSKSLLQNVKFISLNALYEDHEQQQATAKLVAYAPQNHKSHLIQVDTSSKKPRVGEYIVFHVRTNYFAQSFNYLLISKGIILHSGTEEMNSNVKTFAIALSAEMAPTSTLVVYHVSQRRVLIADSITFPVDGISKNKFTVSLNNKKDKSGDVVEVRVIGEPGAFVALSGVDQELYAMQAGNELTHAEVLRRMSDFDEEVNSTFSHAWLSRKGDPDQDIYFPSSSYGIDSNRTFSFAGLLVFTDSNMTAVTHNCNASRGYFPCMSGQCYHISQRCRNGWNCEDGLDESQCEAKPLVNITDYRINRYNRLQRLYDNSWLWKDINIGPKGYFLFKVRVPVRPANWVISGFGMSQKAGFGLLKHSIKYSGVRPFFMIVEIPETIMQNEQVGIRATIFNYVSYEIEALIVLPNSPDYKFVHVEGMGEVQSYSPRTSHEEHQHLVWIKPGTAKNVYIPIVPTVLGKFNVTLVARSLVGKDIVTKTINVKADGIPQYTHTALTLDLSQSSYQLQYLDMNITETPIIAYQQDRRYIYGSNRATLSIVGDVVGPAFHKMPMNAENMIRKPYGTGESSMFNFASNLHMLLYMRYTGLRQPVTERTAFKYLNIDYQRIMSYQNDDGSFSLFRWNSPGSVWLTAFCAKTLAKATFSEWENFIYIDPKIISRAMGWLADHQTDYGAFHEASIHTYDRKMNLTSDLSHDYERFRNISLTAHVLITLDEVKNMPGRVGAKVATAKTNAVRYLETMLNIIEKFDDPYEISIVSYALTLMRSSKGEKAFNLLDWKMKKSAGLYYWGKDEVQPPRVTIQNGRPYLMPRLPSKYYVTNIETTAYGLLTHVSRQAVIQKEIVFWLNSQRLHNGGWASTQDTVVAMQALMAYSVKSRLRQVTDISVTVELPAVKDYVRHFQIREDNLLELQVLEIPNAWGVLSVKAEGSGMGILQLSMQYNVDWKRHQIAPPVPAFNLDVSALYWGKNNSHIEIKSCQRWTNLAESYRSGLAVFEATIPTGYVVAQKSLDTYVRSRVVRNLKRAHYFPKKVIFYFDFLDRYDICVNFTMQRWYPVANNSRYLPMKVYDYYAPERFNETSVDVYTLYSLNICQVCGSYQCPFCPIFSLGSIFHENFKLLIFSSLFVIFIVRHSTSLS
uniref:Macroglobulin complement-related 1 n=1 Tax=Ammothea sp. RS-2014 TaxID=1569307 RepID=A0A0E3VMY4_9CHEL|nr:macroglobulin complement-related 1 [Ammothea sp. RS-2014]